MVRKLAILFVVGGSLGLAACNTVRGAAADLNSAANCTEEAMRSGRC
jgi:predicted small secreted protein